MQSKSIAIIATLDTRGKAVEYLRGCIRERGHNPIVIDVCTALKDPPFKPDITHEEVAEAIGKSIKEIARLEEAEAISVMAEGASNIKPPSARCVVYLLLQHSSSQISCLISLNHKTPDEWI